MSIMLTGYSERGCQEFILPSVDNSNYSVFLDHSIFGLAEDVEVQFDIIEGVWKFRGISDNAILGKRSVEIGTAIKAGDTIHIETGIEHIAVVVFDFEESISGLRKYAIQIPCQLSIGSEDDNIITCKGNTFISRHHAILSIERNSCTIIDKSTNGSFVQGRRVRGTEQIQFGDCLSLFGVQIVWLGEIIAIGTKYGTTECKLRKVDPQVRPVSFKKLNSAVEKRTYFRRSPRNLPKLYDDKIEIEAPPQPQQQASRPLLLTVGPSLTMALPMLIGTSIAIIGSRANGSSAGIYMYTGIIIAVLSAVIGAIWALVNINYSKKQVKEAESYRIRKYQEYIVQIEKQIAEKYRYNEQSLHFIYPDSKTCCSYGENTPEMWSRNRTHQDFLFMRLGVGALPFQCPLIIPQKKFTLINDELASKPQELFDQYRYHQKVPIGIDLGKKKIVGIVGQDKSMATEIMRNLVVQAAANICYTELKMVFLFDGITPSELAKWSFAKWLPHVWSVDHKIRYYASTGSERSEVCYSLASILRSRSENSSDLNSQIYKPYYLVFVANPDLLDGEPVAKYLLNPEEDLGVSTILLAERYEELPNSCVNIIENDTAFCGIMNTELGDEARRAVIFDNVSLEDADQFARTISSIEVRETESGGEIPDSLSFLDMYQVKTISQLNIADRWLKNRTYENLRVPIGRKAGGAIWSLDIHEKYHGPHGLVAGTTGSGKSETLQTYILSLAVNFSPNDVAFFLIDFKGGGMANLFEKLPHTVGSISNLSGNQIQRAMISIKSENMRRQRVFGEYGVNHIDQYTRLLKDGEATLPIPHLFIIIDEFAELKRNEPDFMRELISVAQVGRSLGVHLILATQKPSGTVDDNIWSNTRFRLCLRVQDRQDSNDVLHKPDAAYLTQAGRCYMQVGNDEIYDLFQSGWSGEVYEDNPFVTGTEIANICNNIGKSAITGNIQKARLIEKKRIAWLQTLWQCSQKAAFQARISISEVENNDVFWSVLYQLIKETGYDYHETPLNTTRAADFIKACAIMEGTVPNKQEIVAGISVSFQNSGRQLPEVKEKTQLSAIVDYISKEVNAPTGKDSFYLWLPIMPSELYLFDVSKDLMFDGETWPQNTYETSLSVPVGLYDDPANQEQMPLTVDLADCGNLAICGSIMSGKSTFLQTMVFALVNRFSPDRLNFYMLDYSNHLLSPFESLVHVGGVVYDNEPDKAEKLFVLLNKTLSERKSLFQGGGFAQYAKATGEVIPSIVVVIDNYASFREKTENKYETDLIQLSRDGANYGLYLVITAGGFGAAEIQNRIADNFRSVLCLELGDRFKYAEVLRTHQFNILPEANIKGRGLANINGRILEFQAALPIKAVDDYDRAEKLKVCFAEMNRVWKGIHAPKIPTIPADPTWSDFVQYEGVLSTTSCLPFGWNSKDASIVSIDLSKAYCWLIDGRPRTGKTNLIKALARAAASRDSTRFIVEFDSTKLQRFAEENKATYVSNGASLFSALKSLLPVFKERNARKQELLNQGLYEEDIYPEMSKFKPIFVFIDNLNDFIQTAYQPPEGVGSMSGFLENIIEKGFLHNIFIIAALDSTNSVSVSRYKAYSLITGYKSGIHLGGNVAAQRLFDFSTLPYLEQTKTTPAGTGLVPPSDSCPIIQEVVIPNMKG